MKDAYWFKHNSNARNDEKILDLRHELGYEGYGIYWALLEYLRDLEGYEGELKLKRITMALQAEEGLIEQVIKGYGLFVINESGRFSSPELNEWMERMDEKRKINSENAKKKHAGKTAKEEESERTAIAEPSQSHRNAIREDDTTLENSKAKNNTPDERVQGEKGESAFFSECLKIRKSEPVVLFFEYLYFVLINEFKTIQEKRSNFIDYWRNSKPETNKIEIKKRLIGMAKIGYELSAEQCKEQIDKFMTKLTQERSEVDSYQDFLEQLKSEGFEPSESLKGLANGYLKF